MVDSRSVSDRSSTTTIIPIIRHEINVTVSSHSYGQGNPLVSPHITAISETCWLAFWPMLICASSEGHSLGLIVRNLSWLVYN